MLKLKVPPTEFYDRSKEVFWNTPAVTLTLEHSLISIAKWESKHKKAFLSRRDLTRNEIIDYIRCMTISPSDTPDHIYDGLSTEMINLVFAYVDDPMSATYMLQDNQRGGFGDTVTSELIYFWLVQLQIPFEVEKWHLNRLLKLITICNRKNSPKGRMSNASILQKNAEINAKRKAQYNSKG